MTELPPTPSNVVTATSNRDKASRPNADEVPGADRAAETPQSFAATLKSLAEKKSTNSAQNEQPANNPATMAELVVAPLITPKTPEVSVLLDESSTSPMDPSALVTLLQAGASPTAPTPAHALAAASAPLVNTANAVSPAPTFPIGQGSATEVTRTAQQVGLMTDLPESRTIPSKLAIKAAISAESTPEGSIKTVSSQTQETFSTIMDRVTNNPAVGLTNSTGTPSLPPAQGLHVATPLGQTVWRDDVGQKLIWMVSNNRQQADLVLNPPQLGHIEVTLSLDGNQASANFTSPHAAVREALENSMTRLREVLADAGVTLGQTHVGSESRHDNPKNDGLVVMRQENNRYVDALGPAGGGIASPGITGHGMVDVFA